jgi:hypothetical protein
VTAYGPAAAQIVDELVHIVSLVGAERETARARRTAHHHHSAERLLGSLALLLTDL